jgi:hypothetical protein
VPVSGSGNQEMLPYFKPSKSGGVKWQVFSWFVFM